jgi:hypothetical protein
MSDYEIKNVQRNRYEVSYTRTFDITLAIRTNIYGSKTWTLNKHDLYRNTAADMKILKKTA